MKEKLYALTCENCGAEYKHTYKARVCSVCGNLATLPVLTEEQCDDILDGKGENVHANVKKEKSESTKGRSGEQGGEVF